jgi:hypothetical protein
MHRRLWAALVTTAFFFSPLALRADTTLEALHFTPKFAAP